MYCDLTAVKCSLVVKKGENLAKVLTTQYIPAFYAMFRHWRQHWLFYDKKIYHETVLHVATFRIFFYKIPTNTTGR